jgi:folate-binding protein YgfZ
VSPPTSAASTTTALRLTGADVLSLLHRISTNALLDLGRGMARPTLFCDFRGRLLHRAIVYRARDSAVWLLRPDAPGEALASFLQRHVFRDDVAILDRSRAYVVERLARPAGREAREQEGVPARIGLEDGETLGLRAPGAPDAGRETERDRILAARPAHGHEIAADFNPFEVALGDEVHLDKGCYTGQEALQRLITYGSVRRALARVGGAGRPPAPGEVRSGDGARVGRLTSAAPDPAPGADRWLGLAVLGLGAPLEGALEVDGARLDRPRLLESPRPLGRP